MPLPDARYIGFLTTLALLDDGNLAALCHIRVGAYAHDLVFHHMPNLGPTDHSMSCCITFLSAHFPHGWGGPLRRSLRSASSSRPAATVARAHAAEGLGKLGGIPAAQLERVLR